MAAGISFTNRALKAEWAEREGHTSVIDAAGAIYVIGGSGSTDYDFFQDVWASTDGGARPDTVRGRGRGVLDGYSMVVKECLRHLVCTRKVLDGYSRVL